MPDKRRHRGAHPSDAGLFGPEALGPLREALRDFALLLSKGYADKSALKLVGDHFALTQRQRLAVMRSACSDQQQRRRVEHRVKTADLASQAVAIDGYNLLITIEAALSGAFVFQGRDGCLRDLAGLHGTYRQVDETVAALTLIGKFLVALGVTQALWLLDSPVSNSGRLKTLVRQLAGEYGWDWDVRLSTNPDAELKRTDRIVVSTDSVILDHCVRWTNLGAEIIMTRVPEARVIVMAEDSA